MGLPRRGEAIAACAVLTVLAHLLLAQLTLAIAVGCAALTRATRWRLSWLAVPAAAGLGWMLAAGPGPAVAGFAAGPARILGYLGGGPLLARLAHPAGAFAGAGEWLPRQLPLALITGAAEAAAAGWLSWLHTDEWAVPPPRPGALAALRRAVAARLIRSGAVLTRDGCALGIVPATGAIAELRWADIRGGLLVAGAARREVAVTSLQVVHAALRRRKPLIVIDGSGGTIAPVLATACAATGVPLRRTGSAVSAGPAGLFMGAGADAGAPATMGAAGASELWGRGDASRHDRHRGAGANPGWDGPGQGGPGREDLGGEDLGRAVRERSVLLLTMMSPEDAIGAGAAVTALAADLCRIGVDGDGLIWVPGADSIPAQTLTTLLRAGGGAGLPVLIGTASPATAAALAGLVSAAVIHRIADLELAGALAAGTGTRYRPAPAAAPLPGRPPDPASRPLPGPGTAAQAVPDSLPPGTGLVPGPAVPAQTLLSLGPAEFLLSVPAARRRSVTLGRIIPAQLPTTADRSPAGADRLPDVQALPPGAPDRTGDWA